MPTEIFGVIRVPQDVRRKLKRLAAARDLPMYRVVEAWLEEQEHLERLQHQELPKERARGYLE